MAAIVRHPPARISRGTSQSRAVFVATSVDAGWTFAPIVLLALIGYVVVYAVRWRTVRREGGARAASGWRLTSWCAGVFVLFLALISPIDRLGEQLATMHMVQHLLIADIAPILLTLGLTRWLLRPATRRIQRIERSGRPVRASGLRRRRLRGRDVVLARAGDVRRRAPPRRDPRARAPLVRRRRPPVLVAPALPHPLAAAARGHGARRLHVLHQDAGRLPRHRARLLAHPPLRLLRHHRAQAGACRRSTTSTSPASSWRSSSRS